ncbi:MAG: hypothetical protein ACPL28_11395 [bacterium]
MNKTEGYFDILYSIPLEIKRFNNAKFLFAGDYLHKEDKYFAEKFIQENGIFQNIEHLGIISAKDKFELLRSAYNKKV